MVNAVRNPNPTHSNLFCANRIGFDSWQEKRLYSRSRNWLSDPVILGCSGYRGSLHREVERATRQLTSDIHIVLRLRMRGTTPPHPFIFSCLGAKLCTRTNLPFILYFKQRIAIFYDESRYNATCKPYNTYRYYHKKS
jgi:hypothetical protein